MDWFFVLIIIVSAGSALAALVQILAPLWQRQGIKHETIQDRIERLSSSLSDAAGLVNQIETEISSR